MPGSLKAETVDAGRHFVGTFPAQPQQGCGLGQGVGIEREIQAEVEPLTIVTHLAIPRYADQRRSGQGQRLVVAAVEQIEVALVPGELGQPPALPVARQHHHQQHYAAKHQADPGQQPHLGVTQPQRGHDCAQARQQQADHDPVEASHRGHQPAYSRLRCQFTDSHLQILSRLERSWRSCLALARIVREPARPWQPAWRCG
ncbi:hypothetical protein D3C78_1142910 [compost metagenome]